MLKSKKKRMAEGLIKGLKEAVEHEAPQVKTLLEEIQQLQELLDERDHAISHALVCATTQLCKDCKRLLKAQRNK